MSEPPYVEMVNAGLEHTIPVVHRMGVRAAEVRRGYAAMTVPMEGNGNHFGVMYAGVLFTVAEVLGGALALSTFDASAYYPLVKDLQIAFKKPVTTDVRAVATLTDEEIAGITARAEATGKAEFPLEAVVTDANDVIVATTKGIYQLRAHQR